MDMEYILSKMPYNSYIDLIRAIKERKATLKIMRSDCTQIAGIKHPYFSVFGMYIGFLVTMIFLIFFSIKLNNYWLLGLIPINFVLSSFIIYVPVIKTIAWILLFLHLVILDIPAWVLIIGLDIICISFFYNVWWNAVYRQAIQELQYNEEAFVWSWNRCGIGIEDCYGNNYNKLTIIEDKIDYNENIDKEKSVQLSKIIMQALGTSDINETLEKTWQYYRENGTNINEIRFSSANPYIILAEIMMQALGTDNIDDTIDKAIEFYREQGIDIK